ILLPKINCGFQKGGRDTIPSRLLTSLHANSIGHCLAELVVCGLVGVPCRAQPSCVNVCVSKGEVVHNTTRTLKAPLILYNMEEAPLGCGRHASRHIYKLACGVVDHQNTTLDILTKDSLHCL